MNIPSSNTTFWRAREFSVPTSPFIRPGLPPSAALGAQGWSASAELVRRLLHQIGYSLQTPAKADLVGHQHAAQSPSTIPTALTYV